MIKHIQLIMTLAGLMAVAGINSPLCPDKMPQESGVDTCPFTTEFEDEVVCFYGEPLTCDLGESFPSEFDCVCSFGLFYCGHNICPIECPTDQDASLMDFDSCEAPFVNYFCDVGQVCCPNDETICEAENECYCDTFDSIVSCFPRGITCPVAGLAPSDGESCVSSGNSIKFVYGDPFTCPETDESFDYLTECYCSNGRQSCLSNNVCSIPCPETRPIVGESCSADFLNFNCGYGESCCPTDGTICETEETFFCGGFDSTSTISSFTESLSCPGVGITPNSGEECDLPSRFSFKFGDPFSCEDTGESFEQERQCTCNEYDKVYQCSIEACSVTCPETPLNSGDSCNTRFVGIGYCDYGQLCCPDDPNMCVGDRECFCDDSTSVECYGNSISCPAAPETAPPNTFDTCNTSDQIEFVYGEPFICDIGLSYEYETSCICFDGISFCSVNACPVPCPEIPPMEGDDCAAPFVDFCNYGQVCCPDDDSRCTFAQECSCSVFDSEILCSDGIVECVGPTGETTTPETGDSCNGAPQIEFTYGDPISCDGVPYSNFERSCQCINSQLSCRVNNCPVSCPETLPFMGESCTDFISTFCEYGDEECCPNDPRNCVRKTECYCNNTSSSVECFDSVLFCDGICPPSPPPIGEICDLSSRILCDYYEAGSFPFWDGFGESYYYFCVDGSFICDNRGTCDTGELDGGDSDVGGNDDDAAFDDDHDDADDDDDDDDNDEDKKMMKSKKNKKGKKKASAAETSDDKRRLIRGKRLHSPYR